MVLAVEQIYKPDKAEIVGILSCMFAGKTSLLLDIREKNEFAGKTDIVFRAQPDATRFGASDIVTHSGKEVNSTIFKQSKEICEHVESYRAENGYYPDSIFIIEAPFTDSGLVDVAKNLAHEKGINVYYDGLNMTSEGEGFPFILDDPSDQKSIGALMEISNYTHSPAAVCVEASRRGATQEDAYMTQWKFWIYGPKTAALNVGGKEKYEARSVKHWQPRPYDRYYSEVNEHADLEGLIEGYVLDVSRPPASLVTVFRNEDGVYARFGAQRDMKLTKEGYRALRDMHHFIPANRPKQLKQGAYSFMLHEGNILTGQAEYINDAIDDYLSNDVNQLDKKEQQYVRGEIERSYRPLQDET
ncbi:MAG: hypothetical protein ACOC32_02170 [Nanoarchaeota archaeon]